MAAAAPAGEAVGAQRLAGRTALVTGALGGIGLPIAERFAAEGCAVILADLADHDDPAATAALGRAGKNARYLRLDITSQADWQEAATKIGEGGGTLHILVNNAGIATTGAIAGVPLEDWRRTMTVNCEGAFLGVQTLIALLAAGARASGSWSSVINLSSILGIVGYADSAAYSASKGAIRAFSKAAAVEFARSGDRIPVNALHPGFVRTPMTVKGAAEMAGGDALLDSLAAATPMGRLAEVHEIAAAAAFLASDDSSFMTGAELVIDGGWTAQ
ncbi:SDR family oxidoreductase [Sphingosinicellaceae bacterium]|nr:SDR family oxidoreductase [Sphingosinicellaceae bacterium]